MLLLLILCSPTVNVDRLKPFHVQVDAPPAQGPVSDPGQEGKHELELLLSSKTKVGVTNYLLLWHCHMPADDHQWITGRRRNFFIALRM